MSQAGGRDYANVRGGTGDRVAKQGFGAGERAGDRRADPDGGPGRRGLAVRHEIEVVIEARHLEYLGLGNVVHLSKRRKVAGPDAPVGVLHAVQRLDKMIPTSPQFPEQINHFREGARIRPPSPRERTQRNGAVRDGDRWGRGWRRRVRSG